MSDAHAYEVRPLTAETWPAFDDLVMRHNGIFGGCWCIWFHPDGPGPYLELGALYLELRRPDRAAETLVRYGRAKPEDARGLRKLAEACRRLKLPQDAAVLERIGDRRRHAALAVARLEGDQRLRQRAVGAEDRVDARAERHRLTACP